jgi:hypothetical protein
VHLFGGRERTLVHHIEPVLAGVRPLPLGKMRLQGLGLDPGLGELLRRAGCGRKTLHRVPGGLRALAHHGQRRGLAPARDSIQTDDLLAREKDISSTAFRCPAFSSGCRSSVAIRMSGGTSIGLSSKPRRLPCLHVADGLALHAQHRGGRVLRAGPQRSRPGETPRPAPCARTPPALELKSSAPCPGRAPPPVCLSGHGPPRARRDDRGRRSRPAVRP